MTSSFRDEFVTDAYDELEELFAEAVTYKPVSDRHPLYGAYPVQATFVLPSGDIDVDPPANLNIQRMDCLIRTTDFQSTAQIGDIIERTVDGATETWKVSEDNIEPHRQFNDAGGIQIRLHLVRIKTET